MPKKEPAVRTDGPGSRAQRHGGPAPAAARVRATAFPVAATVLVVLTLLATVAAYAPGLSSPFLFDDERYVHQNAALLRLWPPGWVHAGTQETRPLTNLSFALDIAAFGPAPRGHHLVNLALHLASVLLLVALVWRMRPPAGAAAARVHGLAAALACAILALHPVQSASVLYIQGRPGLLATVFGLGAMLAAVDAIGRWRERRSRLRRTVAVAALAALAALSKESGAVVPALVLLYDLALGPRDDPAGRHARLLRFHLPVWLGLLPLFVAQFTLRNPHAGVFGFGVVDPAAFYLTQPLVLLFYLGLYAWPAGLAVDRAFALAGPAEPRAWLAAVAMLALVAVVARSFRRAPRAAFWGAWWLAAVAPTTLVPSREFAAERYLTLATPAVAALVACALAAWAAPRARSASWALLVGFAVLVAAPLGLATRVRARLWSSDLALWREATRVSPANPRAWYQYGRLLHAADSLPAADVAAHRALALGLQNHPVFTLLSDIKASRGEMDSSIAFAREAVGAAPWSAQAHVGLARALAREGRWPEVDRQAALALERDPGSRAARYLRGRARAERGDLAGARSDADALARLAGAGVESSTLLGIVAVRSHVDAEADRSLGHATARIPEDQDESLAFLDALRERAPILLGAGRAAEAGAALRLYFSVTGADRWDAAGLRVQARALRAQGREREAAAADSTAAKAARHHGL